MATPTSPNRVRAAHDALWAMVEGVFPDAARHRNPAGDKRPAEKVGGLAAYVAQRDDRTPDVLGVLTGVGGPIYDLKAEPEILLAFSGKTKDERAVAADAQLELLKTALAADRLLGGVVDYAEIGLAEPADVSDSDWMAGGMTVRVPLLFQASTPAG